MNMNITKKDIFSGCLLAAIAHAIMTNIYPELSYEQSWDGETYSLQNSSGLRGSITFWTDYCIGAIRNDSSDFLLGGNHIQEYMTSFPSNIVNKAYAETLQYLLLEREGTVAPFVTSVFWADETAIHYERRYLDNLKRDFKLLENITLPETAAINKWKTYYGMDSNSIELLVSLYRLKTSNFVSKIVLGKKQKELIPGDFINDECAESLKELNIFL